MLLELRRKYGAHLPLIRGVSRLYFGAALRALVPGLPSGLPERGSAVVDPASSPLLRTFPRRRIYFEVEPTRVRVQVREAGEGPYPSELPSPGATFPSRFFSECSPPMPCPHCGVASSRFRVLRDSVLVCLACGRSFEESG